MCSNNILCVNILYSNMVILCNEMQGKYSQNEQ